MGGHGLNSIIFSGELLLLNPRLLDGSLAQLLYAELMAKTTSVGQGQHPWKASGMTANWQ